MTIENTPDESEFIVPADNEVIEGAEASLTPADDVEIKEDDDDSEGVVESAEQIAANKAAAKEAFKRRKAERESFASQSRIQELENQVRALASSKSPENKEAVAAAPKKPNPAYFDLGRWDEKYEAALSDWMDHRDDFILKQAEERASSATRELGESARRQRENADLESVGNDVGKRGIDKYSDFQDTVQDALEAMPPAPEALKHLVRLSNAEDVFYHLAQNPDALESITDLDPMGQALEFGKISARLAAKSKVASQTTKAKPSPQQPRGTGGKFTSDADANYEKLLKSNNNPWN